MPVCELHLEEDGDGCWPDFADKTVHECTDVIHVTGLRRGMTSGKPSVSMRFDLKDGSVVFGQTSLEIFLSVADALKARYGDPRR